jgi:predicted Zn-dependent protease
MSSGDIFFNTSYGWNTRGDACTPPTSWYHQETAALHELGHILGLNHSAYDQAVMYASLPACVFKGLDGDDRNGATSIYGTRLR